MIAKNAIMIRTATGTLTERLDQTKEPVSFVLNPGTADVVTVMAHVVIVNHQAADTLISMSIIGPAGLYPSFRRKRIKYYKGEEGRAPRKCFLRAKFPIDYDSPFANSSQALCAFTGTVISKILTPRNAKEIEFARSRLATWQTAALPEFTEIFDRSIRVLATPEPAPPQIRNPEYRHIRPLNTNVVDLKAKLATPGTELVVLELFSGRMATTEALLRQGVTIRKAYGCELDAKTRKIAMRRLAVLRALFPQLLSADASRTSKACRTMFGRSSETT